MNVGKHLIEQIDNNLKYIDRDDYNSFKQYILNHDRIFIIGLGRSGLVGKFFGMRLMHLGKNLYIIGETNTPSLHKNDVLLGISGSGETSCVLDVFEKANKLGVHTVSLTEKEDSSLEKLSEFNLRIPKNKITSDRIIPLGTSFELSSLVFLEDIISEIMELGNIPESELVKRHINV